MTRVHLRDPRYPAEPAWTACGQFRNRVRSTWNPALVTCGHCRKLAEQPPERIVRRAVAALLQGTPVG